MTDPRTRYFEGEPIFERDLSRESASFIRGYNEALDEFGGLRLGKLGTQLTAMTTECKMLRFEPNDREHDHREGRRARVNDLYWGKRLRQPGCDLSVEMANATHNGKYLYGIRLQIVLWAMRLRSNTEDGVVQGKQASTVPPEPARKQRKQPVRQSHGSRR